MDALYDHTADLEQYADDAYHYGLFINQKQNSYV